MLILVILYGVLAMVREALAVRYLRAVYDRREFLASDLGSMIEAIDWSAMLIGVERIVSGMRWGLVIPIVVYIAGGWVGTYLGVRGKK